MEAIVPLQLYWELIIEHNKVMETEKRFSEKVNINIYYILLNSLLNATLIYIATRKVMFFLKIKKNYGTMIRLVENSFSAIYEFVVYFLLLICIMSAVNKVLGYDIGSPGDDGKFVSEA